MRPELLDAVSAAAGFALANERALATVRQVEHRNRALIDAIPDPMLRRRARRHLPRRPRRRRLAALPARRASSSAATSATFLPAHVADAAFACIERALATGTMSSFEYEFEIDGVRHWQRVADGAERPTARW